jgi:hypothetical protein
MFEYKDNVQMIVLKLKNVNDRLLLGLMSIHY